MKLESLRVVDLTRFLPGPLMTQFMADHGAEVIKVESVDEGEPTREIGVKRDGVSVYFANTNRGKKSLALNLKDPDGVEVLMRLAESSDVMVESFRPGAAARLGIGYPEVAARAPRIVYASISAFGQSGPYRDLATHDLATEALSGLLSVNEGEDGKPAIPALANADMLASLTALSGVLMALVRREQTGRGDYLDVAMAESLLACMPNILGIAMAERRQPVVKDERTWGGNALYGIYETKDNDYVVLAGQELKFATNLLTALGRPDLIEPCKLPPGPGQDPVRAFLRQTFRTKTKSEWIEWFEGRDIAFAPLRTLSEMLEDPHFKARGMLLKDARGWDHLGIPIRFEQEPGRVRFDAPAHGQHSAQVLRRLGYGEGEIAQLEARGVIKASPGRAGPSTSGTRG
ncbi:MAG: CoA-transferase [Betaproteobacteria bacterium RIFCSPHIGHO2_12_FULL_69_13]|nr:MAG: CoA-transferase [Betaproteobacteria bacterium RIFCSPHIGHO2_12_FULL_69_13]OGA70809.1 MAG: CoA-transferase [Betaproteobacteria bacterium RIFCSPLOWO2_12_FULL_68_20]